MNDHQALLAKSRPDGWSGDPVTIASHGMSVAGCAQAILEEVGGRIARFFRVPSDEVEVCSRLLVLAALLHDLGKANPTFQSQIRHGAGGTHPFLHETLSMASLLPNEPLGDWVVEAVPDDLHRACLLAAVAGHHRR